MPKAFFKTSAITLLIGVVIIGCNRAENDTATGQGALVTYQCKDGTEFTVRLADREAIADLPDRPNLALPLVESDSGTTYSDGSTQLLINGEKAVVEVNSAVVLTECTLKTSTAAQLTPDAAPADNAATNPNGPTASLSQTNQSTSSNAGSNGIRTQRVQFQAGTNGATIEDTIVGYEGVDYVLNAQAGQYANISMATDNGANYFNILPPGSDAEAMFVGSSSGNQFEGTLPASGDYKIRVYLMRSAARRDEVANYRLEMTIVSTGGSASAGDGSSNSGGNASVSDTSYNATGTVACAMTRPEANGECAFGVIREGGGSGFIEVTTQYGNRFSIYFQDGEAVGAEGGSGAFSSTRRGDTTYVYIGEERYVIPDAIIFGG